MSYGQAELNTLLNDSSVTSLLTDTSYVFYDVVVPDEVVGAKNKTINYYRVSPVIAGLEYMQVSYTVNCRAFTMGEAETIQRAVLDVVNRHSQDSVFFVCEVLPTINKADQTDNYNAIVEVTAKGREI